MKQRISAPPYACVGLDELEPVGWYRNQLDVQANGLSGHLDTFWPDIRDSKWIGGAAEGWERMPYWLDGFIPLAALRKDEAMLSRARHYVDVILEKQQPDGWICPTETDAERNTYDVWAMFLVLKVLVGWADATGDVRVEDVIYRALWALDRHIDKHTLFDWGQTRWYECLVSVLWLYRRRPEAWLADLCVKLRAQGFDWPGFFSLWPMEEPTERRRWSQMGHVVNNAMMLKSPALLAQMTGNPEQAAQARKMIDQLDAFHGMVTGVFTGDECLAGTSPVQGTELCAVAEYMYSLQHLLPFAQDSFYGDRLEMIAFNAWPATFDPDMWLHQYDQQVNQMQAIRQPDPVFLTNGMDSNTFGLEPNFGCCTANLSQGWPKLAQSVLYQNEAGFMTGIYLPMRVDTYHDGIPVSISIQTEYPFRDTIHLNIRCERPVAFALRLRIPGWADAPSATVDGKEIACQAGVYLTLEGNWHEERIVLTFSARPALIKRPNDLYALRRGPLIYSLKIGEAWTQYNQDMPGHELPHGDFEVRPTTPWNVALCTDSALSGLTFVDRPIGSRPFSPDGAPVIVQATARQVDWEIIRGSAAPAPGPARASGVEPVTLIPYGCTNLRMTELPIIFTD